jgi:hypothetical protein
MKKIFLLIAFLVSVFSSTVSAQNNDNAEAMLNRQKERMKPQLIEKAKISAAQADLVIATNFDLQRQRRMVRNDQTLSEEDKVNKNLGFDAAREKVFFEIQLTPAQIKAVNEFFEEDARQQRQGRRNN